MNRSSRFGLLSACAAVVGIAAACVPAPTDLRTRLESYDPAERIRAIRVIGERHDESLLPALVDRLDDEDPAVRLYAILALEKLTDTRLGYSYSAPAPARRAAIDSWRRYLETQAAAAGGDTSARAAPPGGG